MNIKRPYKLWEDMSDNTRRHCIYRACVARTIYFWRVCGKDRQRYYKSIFLTTDNVEQVRKDFYHEYIEALSKGRYYDLDAKIYSIKKILGIAQGEEI